MSRLIYVCNYFDENDFLPEKTRSCGPAATEKIRGICQSLKKNSTHVDIISSRIGIFEDVRFYSPVKVVKKEFATVYYVPRFKYRILNRLALPFFVFFTYLSCYLKSFDRKFNTVLFYNRQPFYFLAILFAKFTGKEIVFDVEDKYYRAEPGGLLYHFIRSINEMYCNLIESGNKTIVANLAIGESLNHQWLVCYGIADVVRQPKKLLPDTKINILFCGTLTHEMGCAELLEAIVELDKIPSIANRICLRITGFGDYSDNFSNLSKKNSWVEFLGNVSREKYEEVIADSHVGVVLRKPTSALGQTTFPSKVVEFVKNGMVVVSHEMIDIKILLDDYAFWINEKSSLVSIIRKITLMNNSELFNMSIKSQSRLLTKLDSEKVGFELKEFLNL